MITPKILVLAAAATAAVALTACSSSGTPSAAGFGIGPAGRIAGEATPGIGGKEIEPRLR